MWGIRIRMCNVEKGYKKILMPWCGYIMEGNCECLKVSGGLYTQCNNEKSSGNVYCGKCLVLNERNGGSAVYGSVNERMRCGILDYVDPSGKRVVPYINIMKRLNLRREEVELYGRELGWCIPECHFEEVERKKRGRPRKEKEPTVKEKNVKGRRGRPRKERGNIENENKELDEIILSLKNNSMSYIKENNIIDMEEEEEEEVEVIRVEILGVIYLKSKEGLIYDIESHDLVGEYNEEKGIIEEYENE